MDTRPCDVINNSGTVVTVILGSARRQRRKLVRAYGMKTLDTAYAHSVTCHFACLLSPVLQLRAFPTGAWCPSVSHQPPYHWKPARPATATPLAFLHTFNATLLAKPAHVRTVSTPVTATASTHRVEPATSALQACDPSRTCTNPTTAAQPLLTHGQRSALTP